MILIFIELMNLKFEFVLCLFKCFGDYFIKIEMIYSCILNGVMFKIVLNYSNIWLFYVLGFMLLEKYI